MIRPLVTTFILFFFGITVVTAQYTETINNNRPGGSQGAFSVGTEVLQFEGGFGLGQEEHRLLQNETSAFAIDYAVRYGFLWEELEVSLMGEFQRNVITDNRGANATEDVFSNFRSNTLGVKYLVYDPYRKRDLEGPNLYSWKANNRFQWRDLIPAVSLYAGANLDFIDIPEGKFENHTLTTIEGLQLSPKFVLATQNNFLGGFVFVSNIIVDRIGAPNPRYGYILTLTHTITRWFSVFVENQGFKSDLYSDQLFRGGIAALLTKDWQVDASVLLNFKDTPSRLWGRVGVSYRFDMHDKDEYIEDKGRSKRERKRDKKQKREDGIEDDGGKQLKF
jgi:hypothetical protein